jgi:hypothetical protein
MAKPSQATILVDLAQSAVLFRDLDGETSYATLTLEDGHEETWKLRSKGFKSWLVARFLHSEGTVPGRQGLHDALDVLEARARFDGTTEPVYVRVAPGPGDTIVIDLCDAGWNTVSIAADGWTVTSAAPAKFRRSRGMLALPVPTRGGTLARLRDFVNVRDVDDLMLVIGWLLAAFRPDGPYPVLGITGEQGSAKSTLAELLRGLVDPNVAPLRSEPRGVRDLMITAANSWVINLNNVSHLQAWLSDDLCRLSTGGGFATRELYTDEDEKLFAAKRPVILNGIEGIATRPDLIDRAVLIELPKIEDAARRREREFWPAFAEARPAILGAVFDVLVRILRDLPEVTLPRAPRMADFCHWIVAAEPALGWGTGKFLAAYTKNRSGATVLAVDNHVLGAVLLAVIGTTGWEGTAGQLLDTLTAAAGKELPKSSEWPKTPRALSGELRRLATPLRIMGIEVEFDREASAGRRRLIHIKPPANNPAGPSTPSEAPSVNDSSGLPVDGGVDGQASEPSSGKAAPNKAADGLDGVDGVAGHSAASEDGAQWR